MPLPKRKLSGFTRTISDPTFTVMVPDEWRLMVRLSVELALLSAHDQAKNDHGTVLVLEDGGGDYRISRHWYDNGEHADVSNTIDTYTDAVMIAAHYAVNGWTA